MARVVLLVMSGLLGGCAGAPTEPGWCPPSSDEPSRRILLVSRGWHTGLVIEQAQAPPGRAPYARDFPDAQYVEIGWGDHDFYMAEETRFFLAAKALLWPTRSVVHVVGFDGRPAALFTGSRVVEVELAAEGLTELLDYVRTSFAYDESGELVRLGEGLYLDSLFYLSDARYHLLRTSNVWAARALREAGCPIVPFTAFTAERLHGKAGEFGRTLQ